MIHALRTKIMFLRKRQKYLHTEQRWRLRPPHNFAFDTNMIQPVQTVIISSSENASSDLKVLGFPNFVRRKILSAFEL